jgi:hypothetical protein
MRTKRPQTSMTFPSAGRDENKELTTSLRPSFLLMTLRGLRALSALSAFNDFKALPSPPTEKSISEASTTVKSNIFQLT